MREQRPDSRDPAEDAWMWPALRARVAGDLRAAFSDRIVATLLGLAVAVLAIRLVLDATPPFPAPPVARYMLDAIGDCFMPPLWAAVVYWSGEAMVRLRAECAARPALPTGVALAGIMAALTAIVAAGLTAAWIAVTLALALRGAPDLQAATYLYGLYVNLGIAAVQLAALGVFVQAALGRKWPGIFLTATLFGLFSSASPLGFEHDLLNFDMPAATWSEMDGWGHQLTRCLTLGAWWTALFVLLLLASVVLVRRRPGEDSPSRDSGQLASAAWAAAVAWLGLGAWIYYNTNVLNAYESAAEREQRTAARDRQLRDAPAPRLTRLELAVDIYPQLRRLDSRGTAIARNDTDGDLPVLSLALPPGARINDLDIRGEPMGQDAGLSIARFRLHRPLEPGETLRFGFDLSWIERGFSSGARGNWLAANGSVAPSTRLAPWIGCCPGAGEQDGEGLIDLRITVSTALDQIAIAPGEPIRKWREEGRAVFEYATERPVSRRFAVYSGRYRLLRAGTDGVALEVHHHPPHAAGAARIAAAFEQRLESVAAAELPYRTYRVVEVPGAHSPAGGPAATVGCPEDALLVGPSAGDPSAQRCLPKL